MADQATSPVLTSSTDQIRQLVSSTTVLNEAEKQYWLDLLPNMNDAQIAQLKTILETEQKNLQAIDQKYDKKLENVAQKYLSRWDAEKTRAARQTRSQEEEKHRAEEQSKAEELLKSF